MRGKRSKQYRKLMHSYGMTFGFREPYQVLSKPPTPPGKSSSLPGLLVDAPMIQDTSRFKMNLVGGLERVLHGKVKPMITQCSIRHLYTLAVPQSEKDPLILFAKSMERRRCNHHELDEPLSTLECLSSVIDPKKSATNRNRYVVASQEEEVRRACRGIRGVPLVYVKRSVMVLEPMAESTIGVKEGIERDKFRTGLRAKPGKRKRIPADGSAAEDAELEKSETADGQDKENGEKPAKKRKARGPKGPNPLSVKKTKREKSKTDGGGIDVSDLTGGEIGNLSEIETIVIEGPADGTQVSRGKSKRKRKHNSGGLDELRREVAEFDELNA